MAFIPTTFGQIYYRLDGSEGKPVVMLAHSLGLDHGIWDAQVEALMPHFQVLSFDTRGHGASSAPAGDYTLAELGADVLTVVDALGLRQFAYCGLSIGGMVGIWLAVNAGDRLTHLVLANTTARVGDPNAMEWRRTTVLAGGMGAIADAVMARCFSPAALKKMPPLVASAQRTFLAAPAVGYAGCCAAVRDMDQRADLSRISVPTHIIAGDLDLSMPWAEHSALLASSIPHATVTRLHAAHVSNLERPRAFSAALLKFLVPKPDDTFVAGMARRRAMLGDAHVDRSMASTTDLNRDFQELITRVAWGSIWTRPGLDDRTRRLLVLVITASMGRWEEYRLHLRAGLEHELEQVDVEEALLQTTVYAGLPAANTGFHIAAEELGRVAPA